MKISLPFISEPIEVTSPMQTPRTHTHTQHSPGSEGGVLKVKIAFSPKDGRRKKRNPKKKLKGQRYIDARNIYIYIYNVQYD